MFIEKSILQCSIPAGSYFTLSISFLQTFETFGFKNGLIVSTANKV